MKDFKTLAIAFVLLMSATTFATAQSKVAHIDVQKLMSEMPEMKAAQAQLKKLEQTYSADIQASLKELQTKANAYQTEANGLSESQLKSREAEFQKKAEELQGMEANIQQARQSAGEELQKKQQELMGPILEKAQNAIQKVAKTQGFQYVLDATPGAGVLVADGKDLLADVKKELGF